MATVPTYNPTIPFLGRLPGGFRPGLMIRLKGRIIGHDKRCVINFINTPALNVNQDIIFHLSIRPNEQAIVRNHFQDGKWMREERDGPSVRANETFEIIILAEREVYKIALNGRHLGEFRHRLPLHLVHFIHVSGDVTIDYILFEHDMSSTSSIPDQIGVSQFATPSAPVMPMPPQPMNVHINNPGGQPYQHPPPSYFNQQPSSYPQQPGRRY